MRVTRKRTVLLAVAAVVALLIVLAFRPKPVRVETVVAQIGTIVTTVDEDAKTRVPERYEISSPVAGRHLRIDAHPGDTVRAGDPLVRIEASPLDPRQVDELQAKLDQAIDLAHESEAAARSIAVQAEEAHREYTRIAKLAESGISSTNALDQARTAALNLDRGLQAARSRASAAKHNVEVIRASLVAGTTPDRRELVLRSPVSGSLLNVLNESEGVVAAGVPIVEVGNLSTLEVVIDVLSREAVKIAPGHTVMIDGWGGGAPLEAKVNRIEPSAFTKISALGIEEQRVNVIAVLENPPKPLGDRFEVQAHVVVWRGDALKVPSTAVFHDRDRWAVFAVRNGRARLQHVDVGHRGAADVEITGGIGRGEPVINHPSDQVRDGVRVVAEKT